MRMSSFRRRKALRTVDILLLTLVWTRLRWKSESGVNSKYRLLRFVQVVEFVGKSIVPETHKFAHDSDT